MFLFEIRGTVKFFVYYYNLLDKEIYSDTLQLM